MELPIGHDQNADQIAYWNGPGGQHWADRQQTQDIVLAPVSGVLIDGHRSEDWAKVLGDLMIEPGRRRKLGAGAVEHARGYSWSRTASGLLAVYREAMSEQRARINAELGRVLQRDPVGAVV